MKNLRNYILPLLAGFNLLANVVSAEKVQDKKERLFPNIFSSVSYANKYIAGGFNAVNTPVIKGIVGAGNEFFTTDVWAAYNLNRDHFTEVDLELTLPLSLPIKNVGSELYLGYFFFPGPKFHSALETSVSLATKNLPLDFRLKAAHYFGKGSGHGEQAKFCVGKSFPLTDKLSLGVSGELVWNNHSFTEGTGFSHITETLNFNYDFGKGYDVCFSAGSQQPIENNFGGAFGNEKILELKLNKKF